MEKKSAGLVRLIVLLFALANQTLVMMGWSPLPFSEGDVELFVSTVVTAVIAIINWYYNNPISEREVKNEKFLKDRGMK